MLVTSLSQVEDFQRHVAGANYSDVQFKYPSAITRGDQTPEAILTECRELLANEDVDVILNIFPGLELVQTALARDCPHLRHAPFEAAFLCAHRYYSRQIPLQGFNCHFGIVHLDDPNDDITNMFEEIGCPVYLRDNFRFGDSPSVKVRSLRDFYKELPRIKASVARTKALLKPILKGQLPKHKYTIGQQASCMVEESFGPGDGSVHYVEGCVTNGGVMPWAISDVLHWADHPLCVKGVGVPSVLDQAVQFQLWAVFRELVDKLCYLHFDNHFLTIKVNVHRGGAVRVLDTHAGIMRGSPKLYRHVFQNGDNIRAQLDISLGNMLNHPKLLPRRFGLRAVLSTFTKGHAKGILNFKAAKELIKEHAHIALQVTEDMDIDPDVEEGFQLAEVYLTGTTLHDCEVQMRELAWRLLADTDMCPWADAQK